ncbi:peptidyl-prolyl cis-trans isomerase, cyclophilin-type [Ancylostoma caninum]|uniref:Spliceosome-associated protein CWC27 homolog n=1 Tax=Ancylostoma caninum TaxID=29170 RepID=A0A368G7H1_ANCCA|nr:peptidyl-prolyl cis-trans isomerase, cyclophilin-type [Ancylostoma caninum]
MDEVILHTTAGDIEIELWTKECPLACRNFIQLCMEKYYNGTIFHRLVKDYIIQGGDPTGTGRGGESIYGKPFKDEFHQRLRFNRRGLVGMANAGRDDNGSQFFFTVGNDVRDLDKKHTLFGKTKKLNLLSFGDEAEEDEMEVEEVNKKLAKKGKSAHDILTDDAKLSKQVAVTADEMADYDPDEDVERDTSTVSSIRAKFAAKRKIEEVDDDVKDEDFEKMIDDERRKQEKERMEAMQAELKAMQKEHIKALRKPKEKGDKEEEEPQSEAMQMYSSLKLKFKSKSKNIVKTKDPSRENQVRTRCLWQFGEKRLVGPEMLHKFEAEDEDPKLSKAKDANLREESEDWYNINDPRNKMSQRRRGAI